MNAREMLQLIVDSESGIEHPRDGDCIHCLQRWIMIEVARELLDRGGEPDQLEWTIEWMNRWQEEVLDRFGMVTSPVLIVADRMTTLQEAADGNPELDPMRN